MAVTADHMIGNTMGMTGALRDEIITRMESLAAAGERISPKQIAFDICSDTPPDDLARMMLEIAPVLIYEVAHLVSSRLTHFRSDGDSGGGVKFSDGTTADLGRMDMDIRVPGFNDKVRVDDLTPEHCARLAEYHRELAGRHVNLSKLWKDAEKQIRVKKAATLGEVMTGDQLEALWAQYARSGARSAA